ncbi:hypothetical protein A6R68_11301 [Neotoma lepida]|uniref:Uncharacterized protein n=1 Tax=Neotoma lepida TaxID=56216 RepID=A0A1A6FUG1_NEOLE|nr:hypothetical protein A6R68_11301 [Neotoma lepida]
MEGIEGPSPEGEEKETGQDQIHKVLKPWTNRSEVSGTKESTWLFLRLKAVMAEMKFNSTWGRDVFMCINKNNTLTPRGKLKSQSDLGKGQGKDLLEQDSPDPMKRTDALTEWLLTSRQRLVSSTRPSSTKYTPTAMKTIAGMGSSKEGLLMEAEAGFHGPEDAWTQRKGEKEVGQELDRMPGGAQS